MNRPADFLVTEMNTVVVCDREDNQIVIFSQDGELIRRIGKKGNGPAEFNRPRKVGIIEDKIIVSDDGNYRLQVISEQGECIATFRAITSLAGGSRMWFSKDGSYYYCTEGYNSSFLIMHRRLSGEELGGFGDIYGKKFFVYEFETDRIRKGEIIDRQKNEVFPVVSPEGIVYCLHSALPLIRKFRRNGEQIWEKTLNIPEFNEIKSRWIMENRNAPPHVSYGLSYWLDVDMNDEEDLFLLSNLPERMVIYRLNKDGNVKMRYIGMTERINMISIQGVNLWAFGADSHKFYHFVLKE